jgi:hypothetical protein
MPRKPKAFSKQELQEIEALAGMGMTVNQIADLKGVCDDTLRKHAGAQLKKGKAKTVARVAKTAYEMAHSGKFPGMTKFWLQCQGQWNPHAGIPEFLLPFFKGVQPDHGY